jgi:hypothetical protein
MRMHADYHYPNGTRTRSILHEYLAKHDFSSLPCLYDASPGSGGSKQQTQPFEVTQRVLLLVVLDRRFLRGQVIPALTSVGRLPLLTVVCERETERTFDWASSADIGRNSDPSRRDRNSSDRGGDNG